MRGNLRLVVGVVIGLLVAGWALGAEAVGVEKGVVKVKTVYFEADDLPRDMPALSEEEAAVTRATFGVGTNVEVEVVEDRKQGGQTASVVKVTGIKAKLSLDVTIWLPEGAAKDLVNHEAGHRRINEVFYGDAEQVMRRLAGKYVGQTVRGTGADADEARQAAMRKVIGELNKQYMAATQGASARVNEIFDKITVHGRNQKLTVEAGIQRAMEQWRAEEAKKGRGR